MRVAVFGTGGIGGGYGSLLASAGTHVTFVARGSFLDAMRTRGLRVRASSGDVHLPSVRACAPDAAPATRPDLVMVAVKGYDLEAALPALRGFVGPETAILSLLNGASPSERLGEAFGPERVVVGQCAFCAYVSAPGEITRVGTRQGLVLGELAGAVTERTRRVAALFEAAGVAIDFTDDVRAAVWRKLIWSASYGGVAALARADIGEIRSSPELFDMLGEALREGDRVGRAIGLALPDDTVDHWLRVARTVTPDSRPSILRDLEDGRPLEIETIGGAIVTRGQLAGVPTPLHATFTTFLLHAHRRALARRRPADASGKAQAI